MVSQARRVAILSIAVSMLAIGLECASAEECDYKTCGALMARDGLVSWTGSGRRDYSPDTKRACAELIEIESKGFSNRLEARTRRQTGQCLQSKRAKSCNTNRCACHSRQLTCNDRNRPSSIVRTGCAKALCWGAKGKRGLEVPGLAAHGTIDNLQLVFPEPGRAAECPRECSKQKATVPDTVRTMLEGRFL